MSWFAQVGHVIAKDVRHLAWLVALSLVVTTGATLRALEVVEPSAAGVGRFALGSYLGGLLSASSVVLVGVIFVILLLQSDSSARSDAFWVTRPVAPSAIFAAKLALAVGLLVLLPLGGQIAALLTHDVPVSRLLPMAFESVVLTGAVLVVAAVFAALTPDLRTFLAAFLVTTVAWYLSLRVASLALLQRSFAWPSPLGPLLPGAFTVAAGLALVAFQYRARDVRRTVRVFALPALVAMGLIALPGTYAPSHRGGGDAPERLRADRLTATLSAVQMDQTVGSEGWHAFLQLGLDDADPGYRYVLRDGSVAFRLPDGSSVEHAFHDYGEREVQVSRGEIRLPGYAPLRSTDSGVQVASPSTWVPLSDRLAHALLAGEVSMTVRGSVVVREARAVGGLPVRPGASFEKDGTLYRVERLAIEPDGPGVLTSRTWVRSRADVRGGSRGAAYDVLALHPRRRESIPLVARSSGSNGRSFVLPGPALNVATFTLHSPIVVERPQRMADWASWMRDAELRLFVWEPVGWYPLEVEIPSVTVTR